MASKSKAKGNSFEREICGYLNSLTGLNFMRVPSSGGYIGGGNQKRVANMDDDQVRMMDGDIITPPEWRDWSLEAKFYKDIAWKKMFQPEGIAQLNNWIEQAKQTSKPNWFLFFKINNCGTYIVFERNAVDKNGFEIGSSFMIYMSDYIIMDMKLFMGANYDKIRFKGDF